MAITSVGYGGTVDYPDYGRGVVLPGRYSFDDSTHFRPTRRTGGTDRTVRIAGGTAQGYGIRDTESDDYVDYQLPSVSSGGQWFLIYLKRDWSTETTTLTHEAANTGSTPLPPPIPGGWYDEPGVLARQPICYARVQAGQQYVTEVRDLRVWSNDGGLTAVDDAVMLLYSRPGTRIQIGSQVWVWSTTPSGGASLDVYQPYEPPAERTAGSGLTNIAPSGFEGTRMWWLRGNEMTFTFQGRRTGRDLTNADVQFIRFDTVDYRPFAGIPAYGNAYVGSNVQRAYINTSGEVHVEPLTISQGNTIQVYLKWTVRG